MWSAITCFTSLTNKPVWTWAPVATNASSSILTGRSAHNWRHKQKFMWFAKIIHIFNKSSTFPQIFETNLGCGNKFKYHNWQLQDNWQEQILMLQTLKSFINCMYYIVFEEVSKILLIIKYSLKVCLYQITKPCTLIVPSLQIVTYFQKYVTYCKNYRNGATGFGLICVLSPQPWITSVHYNCYN